MPIHPVIKITQKPPPPDYEKLYRELLAVCKAFIYKDPAMPFGKFKMIVKNGGQSD